jgi:hypothetical protein
MLKNLTVGNFKVSKEEREAGIVAKQVKLILPTGFYLCIIDISKIMTDKHQRIPSPPHLKKIFKSFDGLFVKLPICTLRHNEHGNLVIYVEDGQHTCQVIKDKDAYCTMPDGTKVIQVLCHFDLTKEQAAKVFAVHNTASKKVNGWVSFNADWIAGTQRHVDIMNSAFKYGLTTPISLASHEDEVDADLQFAKEYVDIHGKNGKDFIDSLFRLHKKCFYISPAMRKVHTIVQANGKKKSKKKEYLGYKGVFLRGLVSYIKQQNLRPHQLIPYFSKDKNCVKIIMADARKIAMKFQKNRPDMPQIRTAIGNYVNRLRRKAA